jgi:hypothetical protein
MTEHILKYSLPDWPTTQTLGMPPYVKVLGIGLDPHNQPSIWVVGDKEAKAMSYPLRTFWTGQEFDLDPKDAYGFLGTLKTDDDLILHYFMGSPAP